MTRPERATKLDGQAVERRTQEIGRELFARAAQEHGRLSALNRWTVEVLSWCLSDPALKSRLLQFIDVLPSLTSARELSRHLLEYFPPGFRMPAALRIGSQFARPGLFTHHAVAAVTRRLIEQVARQFIAQHHPEGIGRVVRELAAVGAMGTFDVLGERVVSGEEADRYVEQCAALLRHVADAARTRPDAPRLGSHPVSLSVKPSALTSRFDPLSQARSLAEVAARLEPLVRLADEHGAILYLDMEQEELRDLTLALAKTMLVHPPPGARAALGVVIQAYLRDAEPALEELLGWLAAHERTLTVRLVKGAYWDSELARARQAHRPSPVYRHKVETDLAFERLTTRLLAARGLVTTAIASHNVRSVAHAMAVGEALEIPKAELEFQLLYGMGAALHAAIASMGYPVRIYTPVGELIPGMAYLVRRLLENSANESFLKQEWFRERSIAELLAAPVAPSHAREEDTAAFGEPLSDFSKADVRATMRDALDAVKVELGRTYPLMIGEETVKSQQARDVCNPARLSERLGAVAMATLEHVERAMACAVAAQPVWASTSVEERAQHLSRAAALMRRERAVLAAWAVVEVGKPWREADVEIVEAIEFLEYYGRRMRELTNDHPLIQLPGERNSRRYLPRGVAVVISPWNFPVAILTGMASAALVTGHAVILKPAEQSSILAAHVARIFREAGFPPGVVQYLPGTGEEVGAALVRHPQTALVLFTGSRAVGLSILSACGQVPPGQRVIKQAVVEMGGKNAIIVDSDADLDAAVEGILRSAFGYAGQKCSAASRLIVHRAVYARVLERLRAATDDLVLGDPADPACDMGPLIDEPAQRRLLDAAAHARQVATILSRSPASRVPTGGHFVGPVIVSDVPRDDRLWREELFGPLLCVARADSFDEAISLANDSEYALTGGVYSRSPAHLEQAKAAFEVGNLYLNRPITGAMVGRQPFGGHKLSGRGMQAGGPDSLLPLLIPQTICEHTARHGMPLE